MNLSFRGLRSFLLACAFAATAAAKLIVTDLRCDWAIDPLGVDSAPPRLAWKLESAERGARQTAWQVRVSSTEKKFFAGEADRWDSALRLNFTAKTRRQNASGQNPKRVYPRLIAASFDQQLFLARFASSLTVQIHEPRNRIPFARYASDTVPC